MKSNTLTLAIFLCASNIVLAQEQEPTILKEKALIINFNAHKNAFYSFNDAFKYQIGFPSLEYQVTKGSRILSFELAKVTFKQSPTYQLNGTPNYLLLYNDQFFQTIARVQFQRLLRDNDKKIQPYWGASLSPYFSRSMSVPAVSTYYPKTSTSAGVAHHFSLGSYYNFGRYFLQANALVGIGHVGIVSQNIQNPALVQSAQRYSIFDLGLLNQDHLFRIGFGMKL